MPKRITPGKDDKRNIVLGGPVNQEKHPDKDQFKRFVETARKLGYDENKEHFEELLGKIASYKPPKKPTKGVKPSQKY